MYVDLSKKEIAVLLVLMDGANSKSKYWEGFENTTPLIMEEQGMHSPRRGAEICDNLQGKLKIWIDQ